MQNGSLKSENGNETEAPKNGTPRRNNTQGPWHVRFSNGRGERGNSPRARSLSFLAALFPFIVLFTACATDRVRTAPSRPASVTLQDFKLAGDLSGDRATFTFTATALVEDPKGASLELLSGGLALSEIGSHSDWQLRPEQGRYVAVFDRAGRFPITLKFTAAVHQSDGWNAIDFRVAPSVLEPVLLKGLAAGTQFRFDGAARPERNGSEFTSFLPADGTVRVSWKEARPEAEGKLFYAAEMLSQIGISPGLMRQVALLDGKLMQGELTRLTLIVRGAGEVTRVQGDQVLAWNVEPVENSTDRRLVVQFNQPQKSIFTLQVQMQTPLGAFPQTVGAMQLRPDGATRFAGHFRIVNDGAVRLEVTQSSGLSQISPEQFPETDATRAAFKATGTQRFAYRFSGTDVSLRIQADQILPELSVSQVLAYNLGENELAIDSEIELDVREAPLRELILNVPKGYTLARLNAPGLSDYFLREPEDQTNAELRVVYGQPASGRQLIQLRLERNQALGETNWILPRIEIANAKSVRGHVAVSADAGFRLTAQRTQGLIEIATAFFPRNVAGIQTAFRLSEQSWAATMRVERLPQTVTVDAFHLFSVGEGIAYGSSVMNYLVSGAPVSAFRLGFSDEYYNVEFTGKDIRNWQKTTNGYVVQLHTPVSGAYTLLATYERPFKPKGETLAFTGARPLDAQSEQGHTIVISAYQFQVKPVNVSPGLLPLETGEVPAEYRLFFDAPILAAYHYTSRPFNLNLALSPLTQGDSLSQVVDRASLTTRISKEGQVLTDVRYFVKNRGNPNLRLTLPTGTALWSATVNGAAVVPVTDGTANLIPLPQRADPDTVLTLDLKLASKSMNPTRISVAAPVVSAPVMLAEWKLEPDEGRRLVYRKGSLTPVGSVMDVSGFAQLARVFKSQESGEAMISLFAALLLVGLAVGVWRWTAQRDLSKFSVRRCTGTLVGLAAIIMATLSFINLSNAMKHESQYAARDVTFLAPVQQTDSALTVEVANTAGLASVADVLSFVWPALLAVAVWIYGWVRARSVSKVTAWLLGWTLCAWTALRSQNGAPWFLVVVAAFLMAHVLVPAWRRLWSLRREPKPTEPPATGSRAAPAVATLLIGLPWLGGIALVRGADAPASKPPAAPLAQSIIQKARVEDKYVIASAKIHWKALKGQTLPILFEPAVLTHISYPTNAVKLAEANVGSKRVQQLLARESGAFDVEVQYQLQVMKKGADSGFVLPTQFALVNRLTLTLANLDVDVFSPQAVSIERDAAGSNTVASLTLTPSNDAWIAWKPRSRDMRREKPVLYAELTQLYVPSPGVIEGAHLVSIRPAQGEVSELILNVPTGAAVTDVTDATNTGSLVSLWRFDPDTRKLRVTLNPAQSRPFTLLVRSQVATGPLPFEQAVGLFAVEGAAGQIGLLGVATGNEVQLDSVSADAFSPINLEDFPGDMTHSLTAQFPGLTVRRAFRYAEPKAMASLKASPVEPDVRVETQNTLSLGEDRTVLASTLNVDITRAGIFRLSFLMPAGFDVDSISGAAMSHWTELKTDAGRVITLHFTGKTEGQQQFAVSLAGPGLKATNAWTVPHIDLREASKQRGTMVIVPEQGMRLQVAAREGVTQLDPQKSGIKQKGVLAFHLLQNPWSLALDVEQVDPWIQVTSLQHATVSDAQVMITANLQYQIENAGLKALRIVIPTNAENVRFQGDQVADYLPAGSAATNGLREWEVKLHRRVIGQFLLRLKYQTPMAEHAPEAILRGVRTVDVNLQRGFVTVQSVGRLQVLVDAPPAALQPAEWQSIPRALLNDLPAASASFAFRLVEPSFALPLRLERHEAAKLLPARVNNITLTSVISDTGIMLTQVHIELLPGDKRLLHVTLPNGTGAKFWFTFVNQNGVWPWREGNQILIPLEQQSRGGQAEPVELFYSSRVGDGGARALDLELLAPQFDLPLENITWRVYLGEKWQVKNWNGSLQLQQQQLVPASAAFDLQNYLQNEAGLQRQKTQTAEQMLALGNTALEKGNPQQARRAFQSAYGLSQGDSAFNEDARVQLHNLKLQQALVGLNVRQAEVLGNSALLGGRFRDLRGGKDLNYTQRDAKQVIDANTADENAAYMRLGEKLIQQQDAAVATPAAIRANIPEQGRLLTFTRAVMVDFPADLKIGLGATATNATSWFVRFLILAATFVVLGSFGWLARSSQHRRETHQS